MKDATENSNLILWCMVLLVLGFSLANTARADVLDAKFLSIRMTPNPIVANEKGRALIQVQNTGTSRWDGSCRLKVVIYRAPSGGMTERDDLVPDPHKLRVEKQFINPGEKTEFEYDFVGPDWTGDYILKMTMAKGNSEFGDVETVTLKVQPGQFDSKMEYRDITIQGAKKVGSTYELNRNDSYTVKIAIQNSGQALWKVGDVTLRTEAESADRRTISNGTLAMGNLNLKWAVPGGEAYSHTYTIRTNVPPGKYELTYFLAKSGSVFGDTVSIMVNVIDR
ncbi:MAG: hypothetical protein IPM25_07355 [Chloracidobacterium sp.]|nr:hypothetical protein [Chloracidobacterium sp.]